MLIALISEWEDVDVTAKLLKNTAVQAVMLISKVTEECIGVV